MPEVEIRLLGPLGVTVDGRGAALPRSRKTRALLCLLVLEPGDHARASLAARLWPDTADPRADLRWGLSKLRRIVGASAIVGSANRVRLDAERVRTDAQRIRELLDGPPEAAALDELMARQGSLSSEPLADLSIDAGAELELWLESQRHALRRLQLRALGALLEHARPADALDLARRRVALDPLNESANVDLIRLTLAHSGRREARRALEHSRARLLDAGLGDDALLAAWRRSSPPGRRARGAHEHDAAATTLPTVPRRPSLAVLGFETLGDDGALLAEGLAVDVSAKLARLKGLFVVSRASAARFRPAETRAGEIGSRLGVRYLIQGTVRRHGKHLRVTVDLVECEREQQLWSERFERSLEDLFLVQDQIVDAVVAALEPQIEQAERERARLLPTESLNAWECFHRAMWHAYRFTRRDTTAACALLQRALREDPRFARAHAGMSFVHFTRAFLSTCEDVTEDVAKALECAHESVSLEPRDALGHWCLGRALFLSRAHEEALTAIDRSLAVNPNYAQAHYARGFVGCHAGLARDAPRDLDMARRLSPYDPLLFAMESSRAIALAVTGRHVEAAPWAVRATREPNAHFHIFAIAAACLELAGRRPEAARQVRRVQALEPGYTVGAFERSFPHKTAQDRRVMSRALSAAGIPAR